MLSSDDQILVTGATGLVGKNLTNRLKTMGLRVDSIGSEKDLRDPLIARDVLERIKPNIVFHLAAKVGGIYANSNFKSDFYYDNVMINTNVVYASLEVGVKFFFAMGTGCAYPKRLENDLLREDDSLDGIPEITNDAYAYAKRGLLVHLQALEE